MAEPGNDGKLEKFKAATAATLRAMARQRDLDVSFAAGESPIAKPTGR